ERAEPEATRWSAVAAELGEHVVLEDPAEPKDENGPCEDVQIERPRLERMADGRKRIVACREEPGKVRGKPFAEILECAVDEPRDQNGQRREGQKELLRGRHRPTSEECWDAGDIHDLAMTT